MASSTLTVRMDEDLKREFEGLCSDIGMSVTTAINVYAKRAVRDRRIPFDLTASSARPGIQEFRTWMGEAKSWAEEAGFTEDEVPGLIAEMRGETKVQ